MVDQDAQDISKMMSHRTEVVVGAQRKSRLLWVVLGCLVIGVGLGIVVYQQSTKAPIPVKTTQAPPVPVPSPLASAVPANVSVIKPISNVVTFPKAGTVRIYFAGYAPTLKFGKQPELIRFTFNGVNTDVTMPTTTAPVGAKMFSVPTPLIVSAGSLVTVQAYDLGNIGTPAYGWINPDVTGKCTGSTGTVDASEMIAYAQAQAGSEPLVAKMCWADNGSSPVDDFNDFFMILSYQPVASPSPSASVSPSPSPSPSTTTSPTPTPSSSPSVTPTPSPSPSPSKTPTPSPSSLASVTPTPSPRVAMPDTSGGTPVTGVFEVTVGAVSLGLILLVLGLVGLLAL